jgi:hydroxymethylglutaryl-CoA synthase
MTGIKACGAYIPWYRMERSVVYSAMGWLNPATWMAGEKAVANYDEDSVSMAVNAGMECLKGIDRDIIDGLYFASVSMPYKERLNAAIIATALDLRADIRTADFASSPKAATTALLAACDAVKAGSANNILVCAADCPITKPGSAQEEAYGDAAAAVLVGGDELIGELRGAQGVSYDFSDRWMADFDRFERVWEDRWIRDEGYNRFIPEAISALATTCKLTPKEVAKLAFPCLYVRDHAAIGKALGLEPGQIQDHLLTTVGNCAAAYPLLLLVAAVEQAHPADNIVVASYGSGSDALLFTATERVADRKEAGRGLAAQLASKGSLASYQKFVTFRDVIPVEKGIRGEMAPWEMKSLLWRNRRGYLALVGSKCRKCGTPQFPAQRVCVNPACKAIDQMEDYRFSDKKAQLFTYTEDRLAFSLNPPAIYAMVDFEGGGRNMFDLTDCESGGLKVGMPMEMSFRRKFADVARSTYNYFWKAAPLRG